MALWIDSNNIIHDDMDGAALDLPSWPKGITPYTPPAPTAAQLLDAAKVSQTKIIDDAYYQAIYADIAFTTAAGVSQTFQADDISQNVILVSSSGYTRRGSVPAGFFWKASDNTQVLFTLADLNGLYDAMLDRGNAAFINKTNKKASIANATTITAVQKIVW